jgi:hypothetical protein
MEVQEPPRPFRHPQFEENRHRPGPGTPCCICGIPVTGKAGGFLWVVDGGMRFAKKGEKVDPTGDMDLWPIGRGCLRRYPDLKPYLIQE